ncbi:GL12972 [Drosophila persimilis]|uniref:GL12972 n=1 Tax=Drosophila persimilis TaxID=7234 RepID=B4GVH2_DROPE|nr:GL12972 [Drosophila persimilis]
MRVMRERPSSPASGGTPSSNAPGGWLRKYRDSQRVTSLAGWLAGGGWGIVCTSSGCIWTGFTDATGAAATASSCFLDFDFKFNYGRKLSSSQGIGHGHWRQQLSLHDDDDVEAVICDL